MLYIQNIEAQIKVSGYIREAKDKEVLIGANITDSISNRGTSSNRFGFFSISLPSNRCNLTVSFIGYKNYKLEITQQTDSLIDLFLEIDNQLQEVLVSGAYNSQDFNYTGIESLSSKTVKALPSFLGEPDIIKSLTLLPGVSFGNEAVSGFFVRGSSSDQNLLLLDGVPVYNPYHLYGYFSAFNADAINSVSLYKGAIPSGFGGRLASVLDIQIREGSSEQFKGQFTFGTVTSKILLEGPIIKGKTSFLFTARRSMLDVYNENITNIIAGFSGMGIVDNKMELSQYYFNDFNLKLNHKINNKNRIFANIYRSADIYNKIDSTIAMQDQINWSNTIASARWNRMYSNSLFSNLNLYFSQYQYNAQKSMLYGEQEHAENSIAYLSKITDLSVKMDFNYSLNRHQFLFGAQYVNQVLSPSVTTVKQINNGNNIDTSYYETSLINNIVLYFEDEYRFNNKWSINAGLRFSSFLNSEVFYPFVAPRLSVKYLPSRNVSLKASYTRTHQFLHLLSNTWAGDPSDMWVPSTNKIKPETANQIATSISYRCKKWSISAEVYAKNMNHLIDYKEGASFFTDQRSWENMVETGKGKAYGLELSLKKVQGKFTALLSYTYAKTERQFQNINQGQSFPYIYDRRHSISTALVFNVNNNLSFSSNLVFASGQPVTIAGTYVVNNMPYGGGLFKQYNSVNNGRLPSYHRLDLAMNYKKTYPKFNYLISFGVYNAYNRHNPYYLYDSGESLYVNSLHGIMPYLSLSFGFNTQK